MSNDFFALDRLFGIPKKEEKKQVDPVQTQVNLQKSINKHKASIENWRQQIDIATKRAAEYRRQNNMSMVDEMFDDIDHYEKLINTSKAAADQLREKMTSYTQFNVLVGTNKEIGIINRDMKEEMKTEVDMDKFEDTMIDNGEINDSIKEMNNLMKSGTTKSATTTKQRNERLAQIDAHIEAADENLQFLKEKKEPLPPIIKTSSSSSSATTNNNKRIVVGVGGNNNPSPSLQSNSVKNNSSPSRQTNAKTSLLYDF